MIVRPGLALPDEYHIRLLQNGDVASLFKTSELIMVPFIEPRLNTAFILSRLAYINYRRVHYGYFINLAADDFNALVKAANEKI